MAVMALGYKIGVSKVVPGSPSISEVTVDVSAGSCFPSKAPVCLSAGSYSGGRACAYCHVFEARTRVISGLCCLSEDESDSSIVALGIFGARLRAPPPSLARAV